MASSSEQNSEYCISVYVDETKLTPRVKAKIIKILTELFIKQIPTEFVTVHKISKHDRGLVKRIALELGTTGKEVDWPVVYINGSPVGSFETLKVWLARKENVASLSDELYFSTEGSVEKLMESLMKEYEELQHEYTRAKQLGRVNEAKDLEFSIKEIEQCLSRMKEASGGEFVDDDFAEAQFDQQPPAYSFPRDLTASSPGLDMRLSELRNVHINSPKQTERKHKQEEEKPLPRSRPVEVQQPIPIQGNEESLELGYVGKTMETIEWAIQNVSSAVGSTFSYYWGTDVEEKKYIDDDANNKGEEHLIGQFSVIQTNWYWRQQNRVLQFYERKFRRLNPLHSSPVRAVHNYEDIQNIVVDGTNFTITYHDASAEYYQSSHASSIADLINRKRQLHR